MFSVAGDDVSRADGKSSALLLADGVVACTALLATCTVPSSIESGQGLLLRAGYGVAAADAASRMFWTLRPSVNSITAKTALDHLDATVAVPLTVLASSPWPGLIRSSKTLNYGAVIQLVPLTLLVLSSLLFHRSALLVPAALLLSAAMCCWVAWSIGGGVPVVQVLACAAYHMSDAAMRGASRHPGGATPPLVVALQRVLRALCIVCMCRATGTALVW